MPLHDRHYAVEEAEALLPGLTALLERLREARDELTDEEARDALSGAAPGNGGGGRGRQVGEAFLAVRTLLGQVEELGIVLRDIDSGLVDFPALRDGEEVYLCWRLGEPRIAHWHRLDAGFAGREPL